LSFLAQVAFGLEYPAPTWGYGYPPAPVLHRPFVLLAEFDGKVLPRFAELSGDLVASPSVAGSTVASPATAGRLLGMQPEVVLGRTVNVGILAGTVLERFADVMGVTLQIPTVAGETEPNPPQVTGSVLSLRVLAGVVQPQPDVVAGSTVAKPATVTGRVLSVVLGAQDDDGDDDEDDQGP